MQDNNSSLTQLHKLIRSLRKQEIEQIQQQHGDALNQIASIARENNLSLEHIQIALSVRSPREERKPRASKKTRRNRDHTTPDIEALDSTTQ
jgi:uncharacterized protein YcbK (DUF882 family)